MYKLLQPICCVGFTWSINPTKMDKNDEFVKKLGNRIRVLRKQKELSLTEFAHKIGKDYQSVQRLELGKVNPSVGYLREIAQGLDTSVDALLKEE